MTKKENETVENVVVDTTEQKLVDTVAKTSTKANNATKSPIEKVDKIEFTGEIFLRERIDEDTKEVKYSVAINMNNPFVDLFEGGSANEYNHKITLGFKEKQGKIKAQFNHKAKELLATQSKIEFTGFVLYNASNFSTSKTIKEFAT